jgi:CRISPR system Cascade subunit CasD
MATLLLRLQAPLQSWGISSLFTERDTAREPSKSGVIGLICAALGRARDAELRDLSSLRMGVRVDREGKLQVDYQTSGNILKSDGTMSKNAVVSRRYYLADAVFLVGLEGDIDELRRIDEALRSPTWQLYLGRKAFPPSAPIWLNDGLREGELEAELRAYPPLIEGEEKLRLVIEDENGRFLRQDVPLSFADRRFTSRYVRVDLCDCPVAEGA